ncbi:hypothetical protein N0V90_010818 [Kalmusia sp. IMI 367209]|nr:hypothetical protein N0V90_010818 [Kalmusia sp. IMI 367209]
MLCNSLALLSAFAAFVCPIIAQQPDDTCSAASAKIALANSTVSSISHHKKGDAISLPGVNPTCGISAANITSDLCRIVFDTATSSSSSVHFEAWLPDNWNGRFMATGGSGLSGCVNYIPVQNGAALGFATLGMNSGHNGSFDLVSTFLSHPEVINDFGWRAAHVEAVVGKELVEQFYGEKPEYNYYVGCSTAARQGLSTATHYPDDFDGMVLGAPGVEWIRIVAQWYLLAQRYGWPNVNTSAYVSYEQFDAITRKTVELFDGADGVNDGIIDNPTHLKLDPQIFSCGYGILNDSMCLKNAEQVDSVRLAYEPMVDLEGRFVYPSFQLGANPAAFAANAADGVGNFTFSLLREYFRGVYFNDSSWDDTTLSIADVEAAVAANVGLTNTGISEAHLGAFKQAGGKILSYHGRADGTVPSELTEWYFNNGVRANLGASLPETLDFYRIFMIPGMGHCDTGDGSWNIGQVYPLDQSQLDAEHNMINALVKWVEEGQAPEILIGTKYQDDDATNEKLAQRMRDKVGPNFLAQTFR